MWVVMFVTVYVYLWWHVGYGACLSGILIIVIFLSAVMVLCNYADRGGEADGEYRLSQNRFAKREATAKQQVGSELCLACLR